MTQLNSAYGQLADTFERVGHLGAASSTLFWDGRTKMPTGGASSRGKVMAALTSIVSETMADPRLGDLLDRAESEEAGTLGPWEAANLREMRRRWRHETAIPTQLAVQLSERVALAQKAWEKARADNDFAAFAEPLEGLLGLQLKAAAIKGDALGMSPYDAIMDVHEPGMTTALIDDLFADLADFLPPLMEQIMERQAAEPAPEPLPGPFSDAAQMKLSEKLAVMIGYDFDEGRIDLTAHPFANGVPGDVRITTRFFEHDPISGIMATMHETGHAMYEAGLPRNWSFHPVGSARGMGLHESQSLLFEMQAGRNAAFLPVLGEAIREAFGAASDSGPWSDANIGRLYRKVGPSLIRVEADEVTYPLHVILRYRIERAILDGALEIRGIPSAWKELFEEMLGITPPNDTNGCLQDIHWSMGLFGHFPSYTFGAVAAAQLFEAATQQDAEILPALGRGDFAPLLRWTRQHVHSQASLAASSDEILIKATGSPLSADAFKAHLQARYLDE
ncbi:carboxypeptidase M32 [Altererythrobacter sp. GH1-8]|uniref:carboxypeptidase M32 n=1 Tax=Altererythrobacter sp. GH1-8 TaxID=3349333 RepID=UPI00374CBAAC